MMKVTIVKLTRMRENCIIEIPHLYLSYAMLRRLWAAIKIIVIGLPWPSLIFAYVSVVINGTLWEYKIRNRIFSVLNCIKRKTSVMEYPDNKYTALITGFGPFGKHVVNASWEAVKELNKYCNNSKDLCDVEILVKEIPVSYDHVSDCIPVLWQEYNPLVVLHVGVSHIAEHLTVEYRARSSGYVRADINAKCPDETGISNSIYETNFDVKEICKVVNENSKETGCKAQISNDAGRYLCEYTFYQSLRIDPRRTLFVHVPDFDKYSSTQTAKGLHDILCYMIKNIKNNRQPGCYN